MTVLDVAVHDLVHIRARIIEVYAEACLLGIPIHRHSANGQHRIVLPFSEIVKRDSTVIAWEAMRVAIQPHERTGDALLRAQAELYEVGAHPANPLIKS
jgi:hypothetical protein